VWAGQRGFDLRGRDISGLMTAPTRLDHSRSVAHEHTVVRPSRSKIRNLFLLIVVMTIPAVLFGRRGNDAPDGLGPRLIVLAIAAVLLGFVGWYMWRLRRYERLVADEESVTYTDWRGRATRLGRHDVSKASLVRVQPVKLSSQTEERLVVECSSPVPPLWFRTQVWNRDEVQKLFDRIDVPFETVDGVHHARELPTMFPRLRLPFAERRPVVFQIVFGSGLCLVIGLFLLVAVVLL